MSILERSHQTLSRHQDLLHVRDVPYYLQSIAVDASNFTVTKNSALETCFGTFAVLFASLSISTVVEEDTRFASVVYHRPEWLSDRRHHV